MSRCHGYKSILDRLAVVIAESKYIEESNLAAKRKESQKQLRDTVRRIEDALFGDPKRLDKDLWLSRFSDLMLNGIQFPANTPIDLGAWRKAIRDGDCTIHMRGYSHVFVSGPTDGSECSDFTSVVGADRSYQEVFSRIHLRELVKIFYKDSDPTDIRRSIADKDIWTKRDYQKPTTRLDITEELKTPEPKKNHISPSKNHIVAPKTDNESTTMTTDIKSDDRNRDMLSTAQDSVGFSDSRIHDFISRFEPRAQDTEDEITWLKMVEGLCKGALQQFHLQSKLLTSTLTPNAALLKFKGSANLTVDQVLRRRSEFLTTHKLNVISVRPEPGIVSIAIARPTRRVLYLPEVWMRWNPCCSRGNQELLIGLKEEDSELLFLSPKANAPHTLIAGSTGSGKSVLMQNIILGIACTNTTDQAKIILIDPKLGVDYFAFEGLPHLQGGIIDDQQNALIKLNELVGEMDRRYAVLKANRVSNIFDLNNKSNPSERPPFLWIIHDEFAEWMMTPEYSETVSDVVGRLGVKARAAGISLVFAAQRPDANVMPMQLRANLGNRLVLRVDGEGTSEIALGEKGAENLLGRGHLAAKLEGQPGVIFGQVPFVDNDFLANIVATLRSAK